MHTRLVIHNEKVKIMRALLKVKDVQVVMHSVRYHCTLNLSIPIQQNCNFNVYNMCINKMNKNTLLCKSRRALVFNRSHKSF